MANRGNGPPKPSWGIVLKAAWHGWLQQLSLQSRVWRVCCWFHPFYMWWYAACEPYIQCAPYTGCIPYAVCDPFHSCALYAACAIAFAWTPYDDCDPVHSCVLYPVCAVYAAHATHLACVPYAACSMYILFTLYSACALHTFFQLFQMIWHFKSDFSLLLVLVMSLFPYTLYCAFMLLHTNMSNCFQNDAFTGEK